jgi:hypothetical protein
MLSYRFASVLVALLVTTVWLTLVAVNEYQRHYSSDIDQLDNWPFLVVTEAGPIKSISRNCSDEFKCLYRIVMSDGSECYVSSDASVCLDTMDGTGWLEEGE